MNLQMLEGSNKVLHLTLKRAGQKLTTNPRPPFRAGKNNRAEIEGTGEALVAYRNPHGYWRGGEWVITLNLYPEFPLTLPSYEDAFAYLSNLLASHDGATGS